MAPRMLPAATPAGFDGVPMINMYSYVYVLAYRDEAFPDGPPVSWRAMLAPRFGKCWHGTQWGATACP